MAINFPDSPTINDTHTANNRTWIWTGTVWNLVGTIGPAGPVNDYVENITGGTGVSVSGTPGTAWTPTVSIGQDVATSSSPTFANITLTGDVTSAGDIKTTDGTSFAASSVGTVSTTTTVSQTIDSSAADSVKYVVYVSDGTDRQVTELLAVQDGVDVFYVQYANVVSGSSELSSFDVSYSAGSIVLAATPAVSNLTFKIHKVSIS